MFSTFIKFVAQSIMVGLLVMVRIPQFENRIINSFTEKYTY
jgi:hypothetical protein